MYKVFNDELTTDLIPCVEANYRVVADREHRALAGLSRGGGRPPFTACNNLDKYACIGSCSADLTE
jgi:enterochelin esterase family protein